ncbi:MULTISPECIES: Arc family DNA-binding protein [Alicyclobacillus]|uniref:Arc family DNA-binding protein n=1 Tax=Alicyclobacillus sendaiensis PA2 TaxID=3029425 RepID=A0ABT6Y1Q2_ALISE|nr:MULTISPECIES: Arc family DNA-binding protein [Alicyclobacillus]MDI9261280.1 Arc family DNA-binding protein [Alicyclobacillus sendaiensis PA2]
MATDKRQFTLRLNEDNFEKIRVIAERSKRSIAMQIEYVIEEFIRRYEEEHGEIQLQSEE